MSDNRHPVGSVRVVVPNDTSIVTTASGDAYVVQVEPDGARVVYLMPDDARRLLNSGLPCSVQWREANMQLAANLGVLKVEPGISISRMQQAHWEAQRPTTILEDVARLKAANMAWWR